MKALLLALLLGVAWAGLEVTQSEVNGEWHTLAIASDNPEKTQKGGPLRFLLRHLQVSEDYQSITVTFCIWKDGVCNLYTVTAPLENGFYVGQYAGTNYFQLVGQTEDTVTFFNVNVDEEGNITRMILVAGRTCQSPWQPEKVEELAKMLGFQIITLEEIPCPDECPEEY
ncbi:female-specific lacrimal gland protein-like [Dipodomys merriami]|uniref:female-specific lacrimal gland protein-like n=1 Tax=Dipodomys merriami TaxID=94247 RepID=UPI00384B9D83